MTRLKKARPTRIVAVLIVGAIFGLSMVFSAGGSTAGAATAGSATGSLAGNVEPALDAIAPGTVGVAASGAPVGGVVAMIVQNRKPAAVTDVRIDATAMDASGRTVARAATRRVVPELLVPEALGLARVDFGEIGLPPGLTYEFEVTSKRAEKAASRVALEPTTFRLSAPTPGPVPQTLEVTLRNPTKTRVQGPLRAAVMCTGESGRPVVLVTPTSRIEPLASNASLRTTVELPELCPAYLVGASVRGH